MSEAGRKRGFKDYLATLVATAVFPLLWMKGLSLARRHADADPRGRAKVLVAIVASIAIGLAGAWVLAGFLADARAGIYDSMDARLAEAVGESEYQEQLAAVEAADKAIPVIQANIANATDDARRAALEEALAEQQDARAEAQARAAALGPNHAQYGLIHEAVQDQDDARVRELVSAGPAYDQRDERAAAAYAVKEQSLDDMRAFAWLFLWPSLVGAFLAPLAFAFGSILARAFEPSDTVGFKPYPGAAAGLFLLLGAFGIPALFFAAWTFNDAFGRSEEGQIAL